MEAMREWMGLVNGKDLLQGDWATNWLFNWDWTPKCQNLGVVFGAIQLFRDSANLLAAGVRGA